MTRNVYLYYQGLSMYPRPEDEECWRFCEGLEASGFYSNTTLQWLDVDLTDPSFLHQINESQSQGIIFLSAEDDDTLPLIIPRIGRPMVFTDFSLSFDERIISSHPEAYLLKKNEEAAAGILARHLLSRGHSRIFFLRSICNEDWENSRMQLFTDTVRQLDPEAMVVGMDHDPIALQSYLLKMKYLSKEMNTINIKNITYKLGEEPCESVSLPRFARIVLNAQSLQMRVAEAHVHQRILSSGCTAVVGSNDKTAIRYMRFCLNEGIRIPDEISLSGFDNNTMGDYRITTIDFGYHTGGTIAANIITQPEIRQHQKSSIIELPCRLIDRNSVKDIEVEWQE